MTISYVTSGSPVNGTTTANATYPTVPGAPTAGNILLLFVTNKHDEHTVSTPAGWTAPANNSYTGGAGSEGTDDEGTTRVTVFYQVAAGGETGAVTVSVPSGNVATGQIVEFARSAGTGWEVACAGGSVNAGGTTAWSATMGADPGILAGDFVVAASAINTDAYTYTSESIATTGIVYNVQAEVADASNAQGADLRHVVSRHSITSGTSSAASVYTMTASSSATNAPAGATMIVRLREQAASLTDVDTDETILAAQTGRTYTGTGLTDADGLDVVTGTKSAATTSFVATNATSGTFTAPTDAAIRTAGVKYGACTFSIEDGGVALATLAGTISPSSAFLIHNVTDISEAADTDCIYNAWSPSAAVGDQVAIASATTTYGWVPTIDSEGFVSFAAGGDKRTDTCSYYAWDATDETWSTVKTIEIYAVPVLSDALASMDSATTGVGSVNTDIAEGTIWVVVTTSATQPSTTQIKAGQNHAGAAAAFADDDATPTATTSFVFTGLTSYVTYYAHYYQEGASSTPQGSNRITSVAFDWVLADAGIFVPPYSVRRQRSLFRRTRF